MDGLYRKIRRNTCKFEEIWWRRKKTELADLKGLAKATTEVWPRDALVGEETRLSGECLGGV